MNEIYTAIYNKVNELTDSNHNTFYTAIGGRYYTERAPQEATFPYCVGHLITSVDSSTLSEQLDRITFQFSIYDNTKLSISTIGDIYTKLRSLFDDSTLTVSNHTFYRCHWQVATPTWFEEELVWQYRVDYEIEIEQSRS